MQNSETNHLNQWTGEDLWKEYLMNEARMGQQVAQLPAC
jgi:hypothetical protein